MAAGAGITACVVGVGDAMPIGIPPAGIDEPLGDVPGIIVLSGAPIITPGVVDDVPDIIVDVAGMPDIIVVEVIGMLGIMVDIGIVGVSAGMPIELPGMPGDSRDPLDGISAIISLSSGIDAISSGPAFIVARGWP